MPAVGSSTKTSSGRPTTAIARPRRCCWPPLSRRYGVRPQSCSPSRSTSRSIASGCACNAAMCRSISTARTPDQAPPDWSITPIRGSSSWRCRIGPRPRTRTVPRCGAAETLTGLQGRGLARAVGTQHSRDRSRARPAARARRRPPSRRTASRGRRSSRQERDGHRNSLGTAGPWDPAGLSRSSGRSLRPTTAASAPTPNRSDDRRVLRK